MNESVKIAFLGDVTCDRPMLKAARNHGRFNFVRSLEGIKPTVSDCDVVVANLETVFAGAKKGYNPDPISYNSPDELCEGIQAAGVTLVTTANNHCLDMGGKGIDRTIETLDHFGIEHTGTVKSQEEGPQYFLKTVRGITVAFVSMTDGLNKRADGSCHSYSEWKQVNNLRCWENDKGENIYKKALKRILPMKLLKQCQAQLRRMRGVSLVKPRVDNQPISSEDRDQIAWAIKLLQKAQKEADFVIACIHSGGQFNAEPGSHSVALYDALEPYCDVIIGNHPHVVQKMEFRDEKLRAYSLGSVNMSSSADYVSKDTDFQYSAVVKISLSQQDNKTMITGIESSFLHAEETSEHYVIVRSAEKNSGVNAIAERLNGHIGMR